MSKLSSRRRALTGVALCLVVLLGAPFVGDTVRPEAAEFVLWELRVPRVMVGALVGGILGIVGAAFQTIFNNPLATPSTVGTVAGATLGALMALVLPVPAVLAGLPVVTVAAFAGAVGTSLVVGAVASRGQTRVEDILLVGIALTLGASAISTGLQYTADMFALFSAAQWSLGHLAQLGYDGVWVLGPVAVLCAAVLLSQVRGLEALVAGDELAESRGVHVRQLRAAVVIVGALGVAVCVAWFGPIAFVGLIVPHIVRRVFGSAQRVLLPGSLVTGAAFLVFCDALARVVASGRELPVGVVTAALGAPALVVLIRRR